MKERMQRLAPELIDIRHQIHANPELANEEKATALLISNTLKKFGYEVIGVGEHGITAILDSGKPGKTVALRADIDALPIQEQTDLAYRSKNTGKMHACGHDGHTATLLTVAGALTEYKNKFKGKIKFIFQPAEEIGKGALAMIQAGVLDGVDAIFGYHNTPRSEPGMVIVKAGCMMAGQDTFTITIKGRGGHAAHLKDVIDPIYIGSTMIQAIQSIVSRSTAPTESLVISVTQFHAGTVYNAIPDEAVLNGTMRTVTQATQKKAKEQLTQMVNGIAATFNASATIEFHNHFPPTINHPNEYHLVLKTAKQIVGENRITHLPDPSMASEDFSYYLEKIPGCFFFIGNGDHGAIHSAKYQFNDEIIPAAAEMMAQAAINYLNE